MKENIAMLLEKLIRVKSVSDNLPELSRIIDLVEEELKETQDLFS